MPITISVAETPEHREEVFRLRYAVQVEDLRRTPLLADHHRRRIEEPLDVVARFLIARHGDTVIGAIRVNLLTEGDMPVETAFFQLDRFREAFPHAISVTALPLVAAGFQHSPVALRLVTDAYRLCLEEAVSHDFIACESGREDFYHELGYREYPYRGRVRDPERGELVPMVLLLRDRNHLELTGSPLAESLRTFAAERRPRAALGGGE